VFSRVPVTFSARRIPLSIYFITYRPNWVKKCIKLFEFPKNYDFDQVFKQNFGVIKENAFDVEIEFTGWAAKYAAERTWSQDQKIVQNNGTTILTFSASSKPELLSWVMSFGGDAKVLKPDWLIKNVKKEIQITQYQYG
jgi:predicted DNA-binding transcriptional regulator YafY